MAVPQGANRLLALGFGHIVAIVAIVAVVEQSYPF
jgi:hypothetical protein